jgi:site-specific DNA recombinase
MIKAVSYLRCSGVGQIDGDTWDRQREAVTRYCAGHVTEIEREFKEEAVAGKLSEIDRPAFKAMVEMLLGNCCRLIVVERLDRLARGYTMQEHLLTYLACKGIEVISAETEENVTAALMGDPMKRAMVQMQGVFAELEKNLIVAKLKKARDRAKARTGRCEGKKPFGRDEQEAATLAKMIEHRAEGLTYERIAMHLNAQGLKPRHGDKWHAATVRRILVRQDLVSGRVRPGVGDSEVV